MRLLSLSEASIQTRTSRLKYARSPCTDLSQVGEYATDSGEVVTELGATVGDFKTGFGQSDALAAEAGHGPAQRSLGLFYAQAPVTADLARAALEGAATDAPAATALAALGGAGRDTRPASAYSQEAATSAEHTNEL